MLVCQSCGFAAYEDSDCWDKHEYPEKIDGFSLIHTERFCPICGGNEIVPGDICDRCGAFFDEDHLVLLHPEEGEDSRKMCFECYEEYVS